MQVIPTTLRGVKLIQPSRFGDERGWFAEMFNAAAYREAGLAAEFVQDNQSHSVRGVLRGLHYQLHHPQGKLVRVLEGHIWDVAVDLRGGSPTFGRWEGFHLRPVNAAGELEALLIPEGFAHGFLVLSSHAEVLYKTTDFYNPTDERCLVWNDRTLAIEWPLSGIEPIVSAKDAVGASFEMAQLPSSSPPPHSFTLGE